MRVQRKYSCWQLRNDWRKMRRRRKCEICLLILLCTPLLLWLLMNTQSSAPSSLPYCAPIDVVYTWVNGSDPDFIKVLRRYNPIYDPTRYDDKNELRYSLRSLEQFAPWVRHIYIVTNGQIPHWLDLTYEKVTVVPHSMLAPHPEILPTFSSAAIETFLHNIPKLSRRFLYMNDDIFLGATLYPEDLYTESQGVRVYQGWGLPNCAEDCPWSYIGDGACDNHCNIFECQFDGGDCATGSGKNESEALIAEMLGQLKQSKSPKSNVTVDTQIKKFPLKRSNKKFKRILRHSTSFKKFILNKNITSLEDLHHIVDDYNKEVKAKQLQQQQQQSFISTSSSQPHNNNFESTKNIYSYSLLHTNMLLNRHYGFKARNVLAHVGFLLDIDIITAMQDKFRNEIHITSSHRFRAADDLQFALAYYSYLMSETRFASVAEIFDEFDTDSSQTWSDREVRTFLTRIYPLPLDWSAVHFFEEVVGNCSRNLGFDSQADKFYYSTLVYERYEDSNVPPITRDLVVNCPLLAKALETNFAVRFKYKFNINSKRTIHSNFMMLTSNVTEVVDALDKMRRNPRKFNCINDNLEPQNIMENELIRHLLDDFYLSFFPRRSKFELPAQYRNRYTNWDDYQRWRRRKRAALVLGYGASFLLILFLTRFVCKSKAKFVRRCVQKL